MNGDQDGQACGGGGTFLEDYKCIYPYIHDTNTQPDRRDRYHVHKRLYWIIVALSGSVYLCI